jgi:hypothetical protein
LLEQGERRPLDALRVLEIDVVVRLETPDGSLADVFVMNAPEQIVKRPLAERSR